MKVSSAKERFLQLLKAKVPQLSALSPADGIALMIGFYQHERADGCAIDADGDMLLYQWGCYDWGEGETFEFSITRQFMGDAGEDEDIRQLSLTFKFAPTEPLRNVADGNRWCRSPDELKDFQSFIGSSAARKAVAKAKAVEVTLELELAG